MSKGPKGEKRPADVIAAAVMVAKIATGEVEDDRPAKLGTVDEQELAEIRKRAKSGQRPGGRGGDPSSRGKS